MQNDVILSVIDNEGYYKDFSFKIIQNNPTIVPYGYELKKGDSVIQAPAPPIDIIKPKWNGIEWYDVVATE